MRRERPHSDSRRLWRYPVKSVRGEPLDAARLTPYGVVGDRAHAPIEAGTGRVASAKRSRVWGRLLDCRAGYVAAAFDEAEGAEPPPVRITLPDGRAVLSADADRDARLSAAFGRPVRLGRPSPQDERPRVESEPALGEDDVGEFRLPPPGCSSTAPRCTC